MFKKLILAAIMTVCLSAPAMAADLVLNETWEAQGVTGLVYQSGDATAQFSGGVFYGPIATLKTDGGKSVIGMGGVIGNLKSDENGVIKGAVGITVFTAFDNMFHASIVIDPEEYRWNNPDSYMAALTIDPLKAMKVFGNQVSAIIGIMTPPSE